MSKHEQRREARARLRSLRADERARAGHEIARLVWTVPEVARARTLLLYAALPEEVPTDAIAAEAWRRGIVVSYPRCLPETRAMTLHWVERADQLRVEGSYGIRAPAESCPLVSLGEVDAALVPGLAWDRRGQRLGRGAGYYDRLFAREAWRGFRCGVFFSAQEVGSIDADPWDAPLHAVVTEAGVLSTAHPPTS